ncbi:KAT8 regulatory NSL complex subunit 2 [Arapaima gigas]
MQCPPSPLLFDTALALEDQTIREIAEAPMDILTGEEQPDLDLSERDDESTVDQVASEEPEGGCGKEAIQDVSTQGCTTVVADAT